ncbi:MAG: DUF4278 domain-containing protein [Cyanobacteria bacterium SBLK]|nr:DUF4278 domain-containing protein [Cyanobacteria bacterium SBLK]
MKLSFLGATYKSQSYRIEMIESDMQGHFRGRKYYLRRPIQSISNENKKLSLRKYRGVYY